MFTIASKAAAWMRRTLIGPAMATLIFPFFIVIQAGLKFASSERSSQFIWLLVFYVPVLLIVVTSWIQGLRLRKPPRHMGTFERVQAMASPPPRTAADRIFDVDPNTRPPKAVQRLINAFGKPWPQPFQTMDLWLYFVLWALAAASLLTPSHWIALLLTPAMATDPARLATSLVLAAAILLIDLHAFATRERQRLSQPPTSSPGAAFPPTLKAQ